MNLKTRYNLWKARSEISPSTDFKSGLETKLLNRWDALHTDDKKTFFLSKALRYSTGVVAGIALVAVLATGTYAYSSPEVTEETPLYPVKQGLEKIEEKLKFTPQAKMEFYLKKIHRREAELEAVQNRVNKMQNISQKKIEKIEAKINELDDKLIMAEKKYDEKKQLNKVIKQKIQERIEKRKQQLELKLNNFNDKILDKTE